MEKDKERARDILIKKDMQMERLKLILAKLEYHLKQTD